MASVAVAHSGAAACCGCAAQMRRQPVVPRSFPSFTHIISNILGFHELSRRVYCFGSPERSNPSVGSPFRHPLAPPRTPKESRKRKFRSGPLSPRQHLHLAPACTCRCCPTARQIQAFQESSVSPNAPTPVNTTCSHLSELFQVKRHTTWQRWHRRWRCTCTPPPPSSRPPPAPSPIATASTWMPTGCRPLWAT